VILGLQMGRLENVRVGRDVAFGILFDPDPDLLFNLHVEIDDDRLFGRLYADRRFAGSERGTDCECAGHHGKRPDRGPDISLGHGVSWIPVSSDGVALSLDSSRSLTMSGIE